MTTFETEYAFKISQNSTFVHLQGLIFCLVTSYHSCSIVMQSPLQKTRNSKEFTGRKAALIICRAGFNMQLRSICALCSPPCVNRESL